VLICIIAAMAGDPLPVGVAAGEMVLGTDGLFLFLEATFQLTDYYDQFEDLWENRTGNNSTPGGSGGGG